MAFPDRCYTVASAQYKEIGGIQLVLGPAVGLY